MSLWLRIVCNALWCLLGAVASYGYLSVYRPKLVDTEQHALCFDTDKYEAWVAHKDGELRCFMEWRSFPHKVKASYID